ncbi:MAG TPA: flagellar biosynthesis protein FliQ [Armatimonadota bacterium]|nr:flagellar biosynthesis protein FliQ [Armatimonadota bacterium]
MDEGMVLRIGSKAMLTALYIGGPVLVFGLVTGVLVSIIQAVTQIQEMTLTFIPKIIAVVVAMVVFGPWMLRIMTGFTSELFNLLPAIPR